MSRRSALSRVQNQQRAASRMTRGTRMWSEQPTSGPIDRHRVSLLAKEEVPPTVVIPPYGMRYINISQDVVGGGPAMVSLAAGEQTILMVCSAAGQPYTIGAGWTILDEGALYGSTWALITRKSYVDEYIAAASTGGETHSWNRLEVQGLAFLGEDMYKFLVNFTELTLNNTLTFHAWGGDPTALRLRALVSDGCYNNWIAGLGNSSGHYQNTLGYLSPMTSWWQPFSTPSTYLTSAWAAGMSQHGQLGVSGIPTWAEYHIEMTKL